MFPILFEFGVITVFSLWFFVTIGFVAGSLLFVRLAKRYRIKINVLTENSFLLFLCTLLASRTAFILFHSDLYFYHFKFFGLFALWDKGFSFWGAVFAFVGIVFYLQKSGAVLSRLWDILVPSLLVGIAIADIGAFLDGINYGLPTDLPIGIIFRSASVKYISPIHPTQLYGAFYAAAIAFGLILLLKKFRSETANGMPGFIAEVGVLLFSACKFLEEFFRGDETLRVFSLRVPQLIAGAVFIFFAYFIFVRHRKPNDPGSAVQKTQAQNQTL